MLKQKIKLDFKGINIGVKQFHAQFTHVSTHFKASKINKIKPFVQNIFFVCFAKLKNV